VTVIDRPFPQDSTRRLVTLKLPQAVAAGGSFAASLKGPLRLEADQRVRFPVVSGVDAAACEVFVSLPPVGGNHSPEWSLVGLEPATLPDGLAKVARGAPTIVYRAEREQYLAERRVFPDSLRRAAVRVSFTEATVDAQGRWSALSELVIQPGGAPDWAIQLPAGSHVLHAASDGRAFPIELESGRLLRPPAGSRFLPRIITMAYRMEQPTRGDDPMLEAPQAIRAGKPLPVDKSLWQVGMAEGRKWSASNRARAVSREFLGTALRESRLVAVSDASSLALQLPGWEADQWFRPWLERVEISTDPPATGSTAHEAAWASLVERLVGASAPPLVSAALPAGMHPEIPQADLQFFETSEQRLRLTAASGSLNPGRWAAALAIVGAWGAWRKVPHLAVALSWVARQPLLVGGAIGLFWWTNLWPGPLGLAIIGLAVAAHFKLRQQQRGGPSSPLARAAIQHDRTVVDAAN
jgi:hypothetical protein